MARKTFTLPEVAADYLPPHWTDAPRWLARRLNKGELRGVRIGRTWMMRHSDITLMLEKFSNTPAVEPAAAAPIAAATFTDRRVRDPVPGHAASNDTRHAATRAVADSISGLILHR